MRLPATLTLAEAGACLATVEAAVAAEAAPGATLRVDASGLRVFDTAALAVLLQARRLAAARGLGFVLDGVPAPLHQLARLYGVDALLPGAA